MRLTDSHCHLTDTRFDADREAVLDRARAAGVTRFITIGATGEFWHNERAVALTKEHADVFATVGVHPHDAKTITPQTYAALRALAGEAKVVGLGETGLDFHYHHSPADVQREHFRTFIRLAGELDLPLSMHVRNAYGEAADILREVGHGHVRGVMHCFTGNRDEAQALLDLGISLSFSGIVTFASAAELRAVVPDVPLDRLLIETDAPYLTPVPHRGRRNEPAYVAEVAATVAALHDEPVEAVAAATWENTGRLFGLDQGIVRR